MLTGQLLKQTATMIQDWDLQSTLLRKAVQGGARQFSVRGELADANLNIVTNRDDLAVIEKHIVEGADGAPRQLGLALSAGARRASRDQAFDADGGDARLASSPCRGPDGARRPCCSYADWIWTGGIFLLLSTPLDDIADRLAMFAHARWARTELVELFAAGERRRGALALSYALGGLYGWGCLPLAAGALAFVAALRMEVGEREIDGMIFLAERKGMIWLMLPFALTDNLLAGLFALFFYASGSFFWAQHQVHRRISAPEVAPCRLLAYQY